MTWLIQNFGRDIVCVEFKDDVEQSGLVTEIKKIRNWCGDLVTEVIVENECPYGCGKKTHVMDSDHMISIRKKDGTDILWGSPENWDFR